MFKPEPTIEQKQTEKMLRYEYAMYVMLSSYFKKSSINSKYLEDRLKLNFVNVSVAKQCDAEDVVLEAIDNFILPKIKAQDIEKKDIEMSVKPIPNSQLHVLIFKGIDFKFSFKMEAKYNHRKKREELFITFIDNEVF